MQWEEWHGNKSDTSHLLDEVAVPNREEGATNGNISDSDSDSDDTDPGMRGIINRDVNQSDNEESDDDDSQPPPFICRPISKSEDDTSEDDQYDTATNLSDSSKSVDQDSSYK